MSKTKRDNPLASRGHASRDDKYVSEQRRRWARHRSPLFYGSRLGWLAGGIVAGVAASLAVAQDGNHQPADATPTTGTTLRRRLARHPDGPLPRPVPIVRRVPGHSKVNGDIAPTVLTTAPEMLRWLGLALTRRTKPPPEAVMIKLASFCQRHEATAVSGNLRGSRPRVGGRGFWRRLGGRYPRCATTTLDACRFRCAATKSAAGVGPWAPSHATDPIRYADSRRARAGRVARRYRGSTERRLVPTAHSGPARWHFLVQAGLCSLCTYDH